MKKTIYLILLISSILNAQNLKELSESISKLDYALVKKDTLLLNSVLHENVSVTHSNGFTENKSIMIQNTLTSFIQYKKIELKSEPEFQKINEENYIVYRNVNVEGVYDIYDFFVHLRLMEVWTWENNRWQLIGRQSLEIKPK